MGIPESTVANIMLGVGFLPLGLSSAWFATSVHRVVCDIGSGIAGWLIGCIFFFIFAINGGRVVASSVNGGWSTTLIWGVLCGLVAYVIVLLGWDLAVATLDFLESHPDPKMVEWLPAWITPLFVFRSRRIVLWHLHVRLLELEENIDLREKLDRDPFARHILNWSRGWTSRRRDEIMLIARHGLLAKRP